MRTIDRGTHDKYNSSEKRQDSHVKLMSPRQQPVSQRQSLLFSQSGRLVKGFNVDGTEPRSRLAGPHFEPCSNWIEPRLFVVVETFITILALTSHRITSCSRHRPCHLRLPPHLINRSAHQETEEVTQPPIHWPPM